MCLEFHLILKEEGHAVVRISEIKMHRRVFEVSNNNNTMMPRATWSHTAEEMPTKEGRKEALHRRDIGLEICFHVYLNHKINL